MSGLIAYVGPLQLPEGCGYLTPDQKKEIKDATGCTASVRKRNQWGVSALSLSGPADQLERAKQMAMERLQITDLLDVSRPKSGSPAQLDVHQRTASNDQIGYRPGKGQPKRQQRKGSGKGRGGAPTEELARATAAAQQAANAAGWYATQCAAWMQYPLYQPTWRWMQPEPNLDEETNTADMEPPRRPWGTPGPGWRLQRPARDAAEEETSESSADEASAAAASSDAVRAQAAAAAAQPKRKSTAVPAAPMPKPPQAVAPGLPQPETPDGSPSSESSSTSLVPRRTQKEVAATKLESDSQVEAQAGPAPKEKQAADREDEGTAAGPATADAVVKVEPVDESLLSAVAPHAAAMPEACPGTVEACPTETGTIEDVEEIPGPQSLTPLSKMKEEVDSSDTSPAFSVPGDSEEEVAPAAAAADATAEAEWIQRKKNKITQEPVKEP